jgi:intracellular sulfur oxidation DsrE/DsrF family protein
MRYKLDAISGNPMILLRLVLLMLFPWWLAGAAADSAGTLEQLLARSSAPPGVVFEIVDRDPQALEFALPWVSRAAEQLEERFPGLPMALVTHGQEMFALQDKHKEKNAAVHEQVQSLKRDKGMPVHVCETYAGWRGLGPEAFPSYVDVAPSGPSQVNNYLALDYVRLVVPKAAVLRNLSKQETERRSP